MLPCLYISQATDSEAEKVIFEDRAIEGFLVHFCLSCAIAPSCDCHVIYLACHQIVVNKNSSSCHWWDPKAID